MMYAKLLYAKRTLHDGHQPYACVPWLWLCRAKNGVLSFLSLSLSCGKPSVRRSYDTVIDLFSDYAKCDTHHHDVLSIESLWKSLFSLDHTCTQFSPMCNYIIKGLSFRRRKNKRCSIQSGSVTSVLGDTDKREIFILYLSKDKVTTKNSYKR